MGRDAKSLSMVNLWQYANPRKFMGWTGVALPWLWALGVGLTVLGVGWGFFFTGDDFRMGSTVKILYVHVPSALMAINGYFLMFACALLWLIRRQPVSALVGRAAAPVGLVMTLIGLLTGAIWGQPMWGTWWAWDPRLTSFLILALFYLGYIALWEAISDPELAADLTAMLAIVGSVFAVLSRYAARFWNQGLHQGTSVPVATGGRTIDDTFFLPLAIAMAGFLFLFLALTLLRARTEVRLRRLQVLTAQAPA